MPIIRIDYDNEQVSNEDVQKVSHAVRDIVSEVTKIDDVFVYANSSEIKINVAPVEIFIEMSAHKIADPDALLKEIVERIRVWKKENDFTVPLNISLIPMPWKIEIGV